MPAPRKILFHWIFLLVAALIPLIELLLRDIRRSGISSVPFSSWRYSGSA